MTQKTWLWMGASFLFTLGCAPAGPERFEISGQVTYDGQPVTNGEIGFLPESGSEATAVGGTITDGRYAIPYYQGPQAGKYKVSIFAKRPSGKKIKADEVGNEMVDKMVEYIPDEYNVASTLSVDISGPEEDLDFILEKPKSRTRRR